VAPGEVRALPATPGVYRFRDATGRALYLGRAGDLRRRVSSYWGDLRDRPHLRRMVPRVVRVEAVSCDSEHEAALLERNLLDHAKPRWNRMTGVESIVYIGLHHELAAQYTAQGPGRVYGPYLGGEKVRLAVSGLNRVLPLAYAGARLGGFDRDMARVRGVAPGSQPAILATLAAVLGGDATAKALVQAELCARRDAAAGALAFELAARIQLELSALEWILAEQKVAGIDADENAAVAGWAEGLLVTFELREGWIRAWRQRACGMDAAAAQVAATPSRWRAFADRNAQLAARLARHRAAPVS
jgi:excinuclease ABC subunit C